MVTCHIGIVGLFTIFGNILTGNVVRINLFVYIHPRHMASTSTAPKKSVQKRTKERTYLTEEETKLLQSVLEEWFSQPDKRSRDAFVSSEVLPKIQQLDPNKYGSEAISRSKEVKILWEKRVQVSLILSINWLIAGSFLGCTHLVKKP